MLKEHFDLVWNGTASLFTKIDEYFTQNNGVFSVSHFEFCFVDPGIE